VSADDGNSVAFKTAPAAGPCCGDGTDHPQQRSIEAPSGGLSSRGLRQFLNKCLI